MKKWKCTVCGYIHTGTEPPDKCPVCGADKTKFIEIREEKNSGSEEEIEKKSPSAVGEEDRKWKCTVCGYIHTGPEPPDKCPVCGADKTKFIEVTETQVPEPEPVPAFEPQTQSRQVYEKVTDALVRLHAHPISVHIPNGVAPVAVLFLVMARVFHSPALETAAFYNMVVVLLAMPAVLFSGFNDWQKRFGGNMTSLFLGKMICGGLVTLLALISVLWRLGSPQIALSGSGGFAYLLLHLILLGVAAFAGFLGGKLVFNQK